MLMSTLHLLCLLLLFALSRYKNPVDIPVGNSRQKIKSLKARVCISKITVKPGQAFPSLTN